MLNFEEEEKIVEFFENICWIFRKIFVEFWWKHLLNFEIWNCALVFAGAGNIRCFYSQLTFVEFWKQYFLYFEENICWILKRIIVEIWNCALVFDGAGNLRGFPTTLPIACSSLHLAITQSEFQTKIQIELNSNNFKVCDFSLQFTALGNNSIRFSIVNFKISIESYSNCGDT